ncbi:MAG: hypothetical protein U0V74_04020 [Chitinophagales bacterium]
MNWLYSKWWKWVSVVLLFYILIGGLTMPLGPGLPSVEPTLFNPDSVYTFDIYAYNTHFTDKAAGKVQVWFKNGPDYFCPIETKVIDDEHLQAKFGVSGFTVTSPEKQEFDVVLNDDIDGNVIARAAVTVKAPKAKEPVHLNDTVAHSGLYITDAEVSSDYKLYVPDTLNKACEPEVLHNKHTLFVFPYREILYETIRNTFYHVPMWFVMTMMVFVCLGAGLIYLLTGNIKWDIFASRAALVAILFGLCGYTTGMLWSKYTWFIGIDWSHAIRKMMYEDIKLAGALVSVLTYIVYFIIRTSIQVEGTPTVDGESINTLKAKRARYSAIYSIFAVVIFILFVFIVPRLGGVDSLHPGQAGNPAFNKYDLDSHLRMFFYPAVIGWILLGFWILSILVRMEFIKQKQES